MDDWTPGLGWKIAAKRVTVGAVIGAVVAGGAVALIHHVCYPLVPIRLIAMIAILVGSIQGWIITKDLVNQTGIGPNWLMLLVVPALVIVAAAVFGGCNMASINPAIPVCFLPAAVISGSVTAGFRVHFD